MNELEYPILFENLEKLPKEQKEEILTQLRAIEKEAEKIAQEQKTIAVKKELKKVAEIAFIIFSNTISEDKKGKMLDNISTTPFTKLMRKNLTEIKKEKDKLKPKKETVDNTLKTGILGISLPSLFEILKKVISGIAKDNQEQENTSRYDNIAKIAKSKNEISDLSSSSEEILVDLKKPIIDIDITKKPALAVFSTTKTIIQKENITKAPTEIKNTKKELSNLEQLAEQQRNPKKQSADYYPPLHSESKNS
mgnify:CR=1 FL=1